MHKTGRSLNDIVKEASAKLAAKNAEAAAALTAKVEAAKLIKAEQSGEGVNPAVKAALESETKFDPATAVKDEKLMAWIQPVQDPEMMISIVDLGLVYEAKLNETGNKADVVMTLTSPGCPVADVFVNSVKTRLLEYPGIENAEVKLVFEPKWDPSSMASDEVKDRLGIW